MAGFRGMLGVWPVALVAGLFFAIPQFLVSNFHGPWLVDIVASICFHYCNHRVAAVLETENYLENAKGNSEVAAGVSELGKSKEEKNWFLHGCHGCCLHYLFWFGVCLLLKKH